MSQQNPQQILDTLIKVFTPGPLSLPVKFSWRILPSWILTGWIFGIVSVIFAAVQPGGLPNLGIAPFIIFVASPISLIIYGFIGLGIDSLRRKPLVRTGWVWYLYPFLGAIAVAFFITVSIIGFILAFLGVSKPEWKPPSKSYTAIFNEIKDSTFQEFLAFVGDVIQILEQEQALKPEEKVVINKVIGLANSNPNARLKSCLEDREIHILAQGIVVPIYENWKYDVHGQPQPVLQ